MLVVNRYENKQYQQLDFLFLFFWNQQLDGSAWMDFYLKTK